MTHPSHGSKILVDKVRFVDFTSHSEDGLGVLGRLPREIRDMIYGFSEPPYGSSLQSTSTNQTLSRLSKCPLLSTSKRLCVEFLESFVRGKTFVTRSDDWGPYPQFERFLIFMCKRTNLVSHVRALGLQECSNHCFYAPVTTSEMHLHCLELAAKDTQHLWDTHKNYKIPVSKLYLSVGYSKTLELVDMLYEIYGDDLYNDEDSFLHVFNKMNTHIFPRDRGASLQSLHNSMAYQQARLDAYLQLKSKDVPRRLSGSHALKVDRKARKYVAEFTRSLKVSNTWLNCTPQSSTRRLTYGPLWRNRTERTVTLILLD